MAAVSMIREYRSGEDFEKALLGPGWRPVSLSTTLSRNLLRYLTLTLGPRDTIYQVLYVAEEE